MQILADPKIFNYLIMALYAANVLRWAGQWLFTGAGWIDACYWSCALGLTAIVTWGYER